MTQAPNDYEGSHDPSGDFDEDDIFAAAPKAISWTDEVKPGDSVELIVLSKPELIQGWDPKQKRPATWEDSGSAKMNAVLRVEWNGEIRSLWATKPSALFRALQ